MVKKLSAEELKKLKRVRIGKKHPVRLAIENLDPGEAIQVSRKEFTWRQRTPQRFCTQLSKKTNRRFEVSVLLDNTGWVIERIDKGEEEE